MIRRLRWMWLHLRYGACSGFPPCCVAFYTFIWSPLFWTDDRPSTSPRLSGLISWYHRRSGWPGYVPCPLCLISGARVQVRKCTPACGHTEEAVRLAEEHWGPLT